MTIKPAFLATAALAFLAAGSPAFAQAPPPPPPPAQGPGAPGQPQPVMLLTPVAIDRMQADNVVAVKGSVAEIFGNKFILQDDTGRALVELGPQGEDGAVVAKGEQVMVQGRFERGFIVAQLVSHADGRNQAFGPPPPPRPPRDAAADRGPGGRRPPPPLLPR
jgi:uncharacterized protein YdeI (BOF family)